MEEKDESQNILNKKNDNISIFDLAKNEEKSDNNLESNNKFNLSNANLSDGNTVESSTDKNDTLNQDNNTSHNISNTIPSNSLKITYEHDINPTENIEKPTDLAEKNKLELQKFQQKSEIYLPKIEVDNKEDKVNKPKRLSILKSIIYLFIFGILIIIAFYIILNFPALWSKALFYYREKTGKIPEVQKIIPENTNNQDLLFLDIVSNYAPTKKLPGKATLGLAFLENNQLYIPKIEAKAPIVWDSPVDNETLMQNLKKGVVHFLKTSKPGDKLTTGQGNIFISGHSSYYWWDDGKYNTIFANLENLNNGDEIAIGYDDFAFVYKVVGKEIIDNPDNKEEANRVIDQNTTIPTLSLMTCVPVGTDAKRLIVRSELVAIGTDNLEKDEFFIEEESKIINPSPIPSQSPTVTPTKIEPAPTVTPKKFLNQDSIDLLPWNN